MNQAEPHELDATLAAAGAAWTRFVKALMEFGRRFPGDHRRFGAMTETDPERLAFEAAQAEVSARRTEAAAAQGRWDPNDIEVHMSLAKRKLRVTIQLTPINGQAQTFPNSGGADTVVIQDLRMVAEILHAGGYSDGTLVLTIYGTSLSTMNRLATLGMTFNTVPKNLIVLEAGDDQAGMSTVFTGYILTATVDFNASPDVGFYLTAHTLTPQAVDPAEASSFPGTADVATMMAGFATKMGLKFENNGINTKLSNAYFSGSYKMQAQTCVDAAGISWNHGEGGILAIWPRGGARGGPIPLISPKTGMIGYPIYSNMGVDVRTLYNPSIGLGGKVQVQSSLQPACGIFAVYGLHHHLAAEMPDGPWFSTVNCYNPIVPLASGAVSRPAPGPS